MKTKAVILKKQNTNEYDQLVTCYTEELGKMTAIAKSILRPSSIQSMHLDVLNLVDFELIDGRVIPIITGAQVEKTYPTLKRSLPALAAGYFFAEIIDKAFFDYQKDENIWGLFLSLLEELDDGSENIQELLSSRKRKLIKALGYAPNVTQCSFCLEDNPTDLIAYSIHARGVVCRSCFLSGQEAVVIKDGNFESDFVTEAIFESLLERKINSLNFVKSVLG